MQEPSSGQSEAIDNFTSVTGASREDAAKYLQVAKGDIDLAVTNFFSDDAAPELPPSDTAGLQAAMSGGGDLGTVEAILGTAKSAESSEASSEGRASSGSMRTVAVVFFADGFMVDESVDDEEKEADTDAASSSPQAAAAAVPAARRGVVGLSDYSQPSRGARGPGGKLPKLPKLPPLRSYEAPENKAFLDDLKANRVPKELQRRDEAGKPVGVSIGLADHRPKTYKELADAIKTFEKRAKQEGQESNSGTSGGSSASSSAKSALFSGAGQTLGGPSSGTAASSAGGPAAVAGASAAGTSGADAALLAVIGQAASPIVDEGKPTTTLQVRLSNGSRVKARLNLDHTVADLWRWVAAHMGLAAFSAVAGHELAAGFPPKPLKDTSVTLAAADLANAAVTHRCR